MAKRERRAEIAQACIDRFVGKSYDCAKNRDCIKLAAHAMRKAGKSTGLLKGQRYTTEAGGVKVMRKLGFAGLVEALDAAGLPRCPSVAFAMPGDIIALKTEADSPFGCALTVCAEAGGHKVIGFVNGIGAVMRVDDPSAYIAAWEV